MIMLTIATRTYHTPIRAIVLTQTRVKKNVLHDAAIADTTQLAMGKLTSLVMPLKGRPYRVRASFKKLTNSPNTEEVPRETLARCTVEILRNFVIKRHKFYQLRLELPFAARCLSAVLSRKMIKMIKQMLSIIALTYVCMLGTTWHPLIKAFVDLF